MTSYPTDIFSTRSTHLGVLYSSFVAMRLVPVLDAAYLSSLLRVNICLEQPVNVESLLGIYDRAVLSGLNRFVKMFVCQILQRSTRKVGLGISHALETKLGSWVGDLQRSVIVATCMSDKNASVDESLEGLEEGHKFHCTIARAELMTLDPGE